MTLPEPYYQRDGITIYVGDNREVLPHIEQVHAVVTDPPYGLSFMGKGWDHSVPGIEFWQAIAGAMLPGAHLLAFGGTRTYHRMAVAIEDAGYEIRDTLQWLYGSGFPKSHDISKAIDKMAGAEREVIGANRWAGRRTEGSGPDNGDNCYGQYDIPGGITAPATPEAEQWQGWGTALKPAYEPIIMARKPFKGTVAANVLAFGTGAINVDACRIGTDGGARADGNGIGQHVKSEPAAISKYPSSPQVEGLGRWPANVLLDEAAARALDAQSGERKSGWKDTDVHRGGVGIANNFGSSGITGTHYGDTGGASRFFYCAKSSRRERNAGLEGMPEHKTTFAAGTGLRNNGDGTPRNQNPTSLNSHPTVKPIALMRYLIQMVTPPEGIVLDPFMGSGSTLVAAAELGFNAIGIEMNEEYAEIAARRVDHAIESRDPQLTLEGVA